MKILKKFFKSKLEKEVEKAIGVKRKERLLMHIEKLERKTGLICRTTRWGNLDDCPIENFAAEKMFERVRMREIYTSNDSLWWSDLPDTKKRIVTYWLDEYFKNRKR